jgi:uncharacterized Rmd1/YagE family protein
MAESWAREHEEFRRESNSSETPSFPSPLHGINPDAYTTAELFIFSYGVIVFWNFTSNQEKDLLADMTFSSASSSKHPGLLSQKSSAIEPSLNLPLATRPLDEDDFETEEFHFQYDDEAEKPRIYNDMITLRTSDHMIKLAMSHGIAQSTKLCFFEERMHQTMSEAQYVPRRLALEGRLGMDRKEVVGLVGRLFEGRVDVNLCEYHVQSFFLIHSDPINSKQYARHAQFLLGLGTDAPSFISSRPRISRNQTPHPSPQ